jgi:hypothetical protein
MLRYLAALAIVAAPLKAQAVTPPDSAAIVAAALRLTPKPDSASHRPTIQMQGDTATVTVWVSRVKGQRVRVERRAGQWVGVRSDTATVVLLRSQR